MTDKKQSDNAKDAPSDLTSRQLEQFMSLSNSERIEQMTIFLRTEEQSERRGVASASNSTAGSNSSPWTAYSLFFDPPLPVLEYNNDSAAAIDSANTMSQAGLAGDGKEDNTRPAGDTESAEPAQQATVEDHRSTNTALATNDDTASVNAQSAFVGYGST